MLDGKAPRDPFVSTVFRHGLLPTVLSPHPALLLLAQALLHAGCGWCIPQ
jgi:hypothetical protein